MDFSDGGPEPLRLEKAVYGGDCLAHNKAGAVRFVSFGLSGELVEVNDPEPQTGAGLDVSGASGYGPEEAAPLRVLKRSPERVVPPCVHFGRCGGCQYQMASYPEQLRMKEAILRETLTRAGVDELPPVQLWPSPEPYGYRNRIRLRIRAVNGRLLVGYSVRGTQEFLPIRMCPIAAPLLWRAAEALLGLSTTHRETRRLLTSVDELELFCDRDETRLQLVLLCAGKPQSVATRAFAAAMDALHRQCPALTGAGLVQLDPRSGRMLEAGAAWGTAGLPYPVADETYWVARGGFFQVNRFLLPTLVDLVCDGRQGGMGWDLFAGVGLFSRVLARAYGIITAVEANPVAAGELRRALEKLNASAKLNKTGESSPQHRAVQATVLDFLRGAALQRERPELVVLDPPRAGLGEEAARLLAQLQPAKIVYLSCDPTTLARDLKVMTALGYTLTALHLIDLFPQTFHLETLAVLERGREQSREATG